MIKHLVMFKLAAEGADARGAATATIRDALEPLGDLPGVDHLRVHTDLGLDGHWDLVLVGSYRSREALDAYQVHPRHAAAVQTINPLLSDRAIVDYPVDEA